MRSFLTVLFVIFSIFNAGASQGGFSQAVAEANAREQQDQKFIAMIYNKVINNSENYPENILGIMFRMFEKSGMGKPVTKVIPSRTEPNTYEIYFDYFKFYKRSPGVTIVVEVIMINGRPLVLKVFTKDLDMPTGGVSWGNR